MVDTDKWERVHNEAEVMGTSLDSIDKEIMNLEVEINQILQPKEIVNL